MTQTVVVPLFPGFEEIEAITIIDVLRRAEINVISIGPDPGPVRGAHDISVHADRAVEDAPPATEIAMIALPGGMPGAKHLAEDSALQNLVKSVAAAGGFLAAICAAPMALASAGLVKGKHVTCYPGFEKYLEGAILSDQPVVVDGKLITGRGPGLAAAFALELVTRLRGPEAAAKVGKGMLL